MTRGQRDLAHHHQPAEIYRGDVTNSVSAFDGSRAMQSELPGVKPHRVKLAYSQRGKSAEACDSF